MAESLPQLRPPRRIITSHDKEGKAIFAVDDHPEMETRPGASDEEISKLRGSVFWSSDRSPANNSTPLCQKAINNSRRAGTTIRISDFGPGLSSPLHRTLSLDYAILLAGDHVELELDHGVCRKLEVGDVVVQRGTIHAWHNRGETWARFVFVLIDAEEVKVGDMVLPEKLP